MEKTESTETETYNGLGEKDTADELQKVEPDDKTNNGQGNAFGLQDSKPGVDWEMRGETRSLKQVQTSNEVRIYP